MASRRRRIAVVWPSIEGGVRTITSRLVKGLLLEGMDVTLFSLRKSRPLVNLHLDLKNIGELRNYDAVIYMGSIPRINHLFLRKDQLKILFVHGFVVQEKIRAIRDQFSKILSLAPLYLWGISKSAKTIDLFVCHSITSCEMNSVLEKSVLLPQFVLNEEVKIYDRLLTGYSSQRSVVRIVTYASFAESPRLLKEIHVLTAVIKAARRANRNVELLIIDPRRNECIEHRINLMIRRVKWLPKRLFLKVLLNSDLYIEQCIDEELGYGSIEAGLLGVPVAKLTHPTYADRQDYDENQLVVAYSFSQFIDKLAEYIRHVDDHKAYYSKRIREFVTARRVWDSVKAPLIRYLASL